MMNCFFYSMFFMLFLNVSFGSLRYSQINRVFMSIYKGMLEASLVTIDDQGEPTRPFYSISTLNNYVDVYLKNNLSKFSKDYTVSTEFKDELTDEICSYQCRKVKINLNAKINAFYEYNNSQTFVVADGELL